MAKKKTTSDSPFVPVEEQPYRIPDNWCWTRMQNIAQWGSGGTPSRKNPQYYQGTIPWIKTGELNDDYIFETEEHISGDAIAHSSAKLFPVNTIAIAMYGATIGKAGILGIEAATNQACACGVASTAIYFKYLFYYACSEKDNFVKKGKGGAQPNISQEIIKMHEIPLPPLPEQQRIVSRIESLFAKLDEAKEKAQAVVDGFELRKSAILHKAFTGELTAKWRKEKGVGLDNWEIQKFGQVVKNLDAKRIPLSQQQRSDMCRKYDYYGASGVIDKVDDYLFDGRYLLIGEDGANLVTRSKPIAFVAEGQYWVNNHAHILAMCPQMVMDFLCYYINSIDLIPYVTGSAQPKLTQNKMNLIPVPVPSISEQVQIVLILDSVFSHEHQAKAAAEAVLDQIDTMKKAILARAFRGELGTNDPEEESAARMITNILE